MLQYSAQSSVTLYKDNFARFIFASCFDEGPGQQHGNHEANTVHGINTKSYLNSILLMANSKTGQVITIKSSNSTKITYS